MALELAHEPNHFLATVQVSISLIGTFAAAFGGDVRADPIAQQLSPIVRPALPPLLGLTDAHLTTVWEGCAKEETCYQRSISTPVRS